MDQICPCKPLQEAVRLRCGAGSGLDLDGSQLAASSRPTLHVLTSLFSWNNVAA